MPDVAVGSPTLDAAPVDTPPASTPGTDVSTPVETTPPAPVEKDDFIDEGVLATLTPESRTVLDPVLKTIKEKTEKLKSETKSFSNKAEAFDKLVADPRFVTWYKGIMNPQAPPSNMPTMPKEEITDDMLNQAAMDPIKYAQLLEKRFEMKYGEQAKKLEQGQRELRMAAEFDSLTRSHPDVWEMDKAGIFEPFLYFYTDLNKRPMVEAYNAAKKVGDFFIKQAEAKATGMVQRQKASVTETPTNTAGAGSGIVYAKDSDEALRLQIAENLPGGLKRQVMIKK